MIMDVGIISAYNITYKEREKRLNHKDLQIENSKVVKYKSCSGPSCHWRLISYTNCKALKELRGSHNLLTVVVGIAHLVRKLL